jgi:DNA-binding GntR family transcriptional regulator
MLADRHLIEKKPRQGYSIKQLNLTEIHELYDVRLVLETFIMERVCRDGMDDFALLKLKQRWTELYENLPEMIADPATADEEFHQAFAHAAANQTMAAMLRNIDDRIRFVRAVDITNTDRLKTTSLQHLEIVEAVRQRRPDQAIAALRRNIEGGRNKVEKAVKEALASANEIYA